MIFSTIFQIARRNNSVMDTKFFFFDGPNKPASARLIGPKLMASKMYQLSPPEVNINNFR
jgi:hypothetical protein